MKQSPEQQRPLVDKRINVCFGAFGQSNGKLLPEEEEE